MNRPNQFTYKTIEDRFWSKVDKKSNYECWEWKNFIDHKGYGTFKYKDKMIHAQRMAWILTYGEIPSGMMILHKCDNRKCVNPIHLFIGTNKDNMIDMAEKGRSTKGKSFLCGENHPNSVLSDEEVSRIRSLYSGGNFTYLELSRIYGVSFQHIGAIINGKRRNK